MGREGLIQQGTFVAAPEVSALDDLFLQAQAYVANLQGDLKATVDAGEVLLSGAFIASGGGNAIDAYWIEARFSDSFPSAEPKVFEVGGRVPRIADRHVYESSGRCCTCVWEEWILGEPPHTLESFMQGPVNDYFVSQLHFEQTGIWPYGERSHGSVGVFEACCDLLGITRDVFEHDIRTCINLLFYLAEPGLKGHRPCPCGSGDKFRSCHRTDLENLARRVTPSMAKQLLQLMNPK